jgi:Flp pilus assembly protein TadB
VVNERLRIGDADRETAARELGEHFALGRITADEHAERLEQIWAARTAADLAPAFRDLPRQQQGRPEQGRPEQGRPRPARSERTPEPDRRRRLELPRIPFPFKVLVAIVLIWWGFHHPLFLVVGAIVYLVLVRRFVRRRRWRGRSGPWGHGPYQAGWH